MTPHTRHAGAQAVLGTDPQLTAAQWAVIIELIYREQQNVRQLQIDKADVIARATHMGTYLERYLGELADLREEIQRRTGLTP